MNNALLMQILQTKDYLCDVVLGPFLGQTPECLDKSSTVTTVQVLHDEI